MVESDPVIEEFRRAVSRLFGPRLERAILFGSRARGDQGPDSDYDVALFIHGLEDRWRDGQKIADIELRILDETGAFVETLLYPAGHWRDASSPLMHEIRREGVDL